MKALVWAAIDTLSCLLLVVLAAVNPPISDPRAAIETQGRWVITSAWKSSDNDVDLWLRAPDTRRVSWLNPRSQIAHLEQDDLGVRDDDPLTINHERMVIRSVQAGEYVANLHCYACYDVPILVTVSLWRLQGADKKVYTVQAKMLAAQEWTAFRFTLDDEGRLQNLNRLPTSIVSR